MKPIKVKQPKKVFNYPIPEPEPEPELNSLTINTGGVVSTFINQDEILTSFELETTITHLSRYGGYGRSSILFGLGDNNVFSIAGIDNNGFNLFIFKWDTYNNVGNYAVPIDLNQPINFKLVVEDVNTVKMYNDGNKIIERTDEHFQAGKIGWNGYSLLFKAEGENVLGYSLKEL